MRTLRDVVAETRSGTKSVRNSLTVMMHVMGVGTVAVLTGRGSVSPTLSGVIGAIAISTGTGGSAGVGIAVGTMISTIIEPGVVTGRHS